MSDLNNLQYIVQPHTQHRSTSYVIYDRRNDIYFNVSYQDEILAQEKANELNRIKQRG